MSLLPTPSEWSPLEEQFHTWDIIILNPPTFGTGESQSKVLSLWSQITITETHEGIRTQIEVNAEEPAIPFIRELVTDFLFLRDQQLLYRLRVVDSEDVLTRDAATVRFDCVSYDKLLERRILHEDWLLDDGDINAAWRLIDYTQRRQTFGITRGTTSPGIRRQRALDAGDDILTAINDFAQADTGFDWWIDAGLKFWAVKPRRGKKHDIQWVLGGEVGEMTRINPIEDYSSLIMATGANSEVRIPRADGNEDVYPPPDPQVVQLPNKPLGLWEMTTSDTDVITTASLMEKALWHLADKGSVRPTYKIALEPGVWTPAVALGDVLNLRIDTVRANVKVPIRIEELSINCSSDGAEVISMSVRAEEPETKIAEVGGPPALPMLLAGGAPDPNGRTVARHRLSEADDLGALLRSLRKRLDRAERSRGIGGGSGSSILDGEGPPDCMIGSPGDYYVDRLDWRLYGPKYDGGTMLAPGETWDFREVVATPNDRFLNSEVGFVGFVYEDVDIVGFRFDGLTCGVTDSFDRGNGALGDDWVSTPNIPRSNDQNVDLTIVDKNAVGSTADSAVGAPTVGNTMRWATAQPTNGTQAIEASCNFGQQGGTLYLFTNAGGANGACIFLECTWLPATYAVPDNLITKLTTFRADGTSDTVTEYLTAYFQSMARFRLESDPDGTQRLYWDNTQYTTTGEYSLLHTWTISNPVVGPYVGLGTAHGAGSPNALPALKINAVTVGCVGAGIIGPNQSMTPHGVTGNLTVSVWDWDTGDLLYRTTAPATGTDWVETPPIRIKINGGINGTAQRWCVSLGGAAVPVHAPGHQFVYDKWPSSVGSYGPYSGPVGSVPKTLLGYFGGMPCLYVKFQSQKCYAATPEECIVPPTIEPDTFVNGEVGKILSVSNTGWLLGWRYKRLEGSSSPVTFTVWDWGYRYYSEVYANVKPFSEGIVAQIVDTQTGEGEFEVRLPTPILMDWMGRQGPDTVMISVGGTAIGVDTSATEADWRYPYNADWYNFHFGYSYHNPKIGQFPNDGMGTYPNYDAWPMAPIMQRGDLPTWPTTDLARSGSTADPDDTRVELHRNIRYPTSAADYNGLRFYEGGPSFDATSWAKGEGAATFSVNMVYDGYSGIALIPDDWYDDYGHTVPPEPEMYTEKYAYYYWAYDYSWWEQDADLDMNHPRWPGSYFMAYGELSCWDDYAYWDQFVYGPNHGAGYYDEEGSYVGGNADGGAGFLAQVSEYGPQNLMSCSAVMTASNDDGIWGTSLRVTPQVIQACFPPDATSNTWYTGGIYAVGLNPKGCVSPLITAASATATAADEPWQKQFFRQMGVQAVSFINGVGQIGVPTALAPPCVITAVVDGITAGGAFVAQAQRTGDYVITVALNTTYSGNLTINWTAEHAAYTFGTPAPSIDAFRNPGTQYLYGPYVEYNAAGGSWPFEIVSWGRTFQDGCILKDFTGATVGGPFTVNRDENYDRIYWSAGQNWYLPGETQQYRLTNPDDQVGNWAVLHWTDNQTLLMVTTQEMLRAGKAGDPEGVPAPNPNRYANDPIHRVEAVQLPAEPGEPGVQARAKPENPGRGPDNPRDKGPRPTTDRGRRKGGKERREARQTAVAEERAQKRGRPGRQEPPGETTPE